MDVNVNDISEIRKFGSSLNSFLSEYCGIVRRVDNYAMTDFTRANNSLNGIQIKYKNAERKLNQLKWDLENAERRAENNPDEDYSDEIERLQEQLEQTEQIYQQLKQAYTEAEALTKRIKVKADMLRERANDTRRQLTEIGDKTVSSIKKAANKISGYAK